MEEKIRVFCPKCGAQYAAPVAAAGKHTVCNKCNEPITIPHPRNHTTDQRVLANDVLTDASSSSGKPGKVSAIGGMRIGSGVCNILAGILFFALVLPLLLIPLGIVEIISGANLLKTPPQSPANPKLIAILEIVSIVTLAGLIPLAVGILSLVFLSDHRVKQYLQSLQAT